MEEIVFGELPEIIIKVKGQLQHVGFDATAEVIAGALGEKGSSDYHVGHCAKWLISEIEHELGLGQAATQVRRPRSLSRKMSMGGSDLINRLKNAKASTVDMGSLAVSINILFKILAFEVTAFLQVNSEMGPTVTLALTQALALALSLALSLALTLTLTLAAGQLRCCLVDARDHVAQGLR